MYIEITPDDYRVQFRYQALPDYGSEIIPFAKLKQDLIITLADDVADKTFADIAFAIAHDVAVILNDTERKVYARLSAYDDGNSYTFDALTDDGRGVWKVTNEDVWTYELVPIGGGSSDHRELEHRDAANQHPISAITGLQGSLDEKLESEPVGDDTPTVPVPFVEYVEQTLTDAQKAQARENIGAAASADWELIDEVTTTEEVERIRIEMPEGKKEMRVAITSPASAAANSCTVYPYYSKHGISGESHFGFYDYYPGTAAMHIDIQMIVHDGSSAGECIIGYVNNNNLTKPMPIQSSGIADVTNLDLTHKFKAWAWVILDRASVWPIGTTYKLYAR